jgi:tRNA threonylcarbamoyladenosine biosynthesis protein TsaB
MLLAIDTSAGTSVAIVDRGSVLAECSVEDTRRHAEVIGSLIVDCLAEAGLVASALTGVAVGMGPGPFTGLRVGIAAANAFGVGIQKPVLRVVSHDAVAVEQFHAVSTGRLLVTTDARRRERYWSAYSGRDECGLPQRVDGPGLARLDALSDEVSDYDSYRRLDVDWVSAASVGLLAERLIEHGRELAGREPLYLRSPDVTVSAGPKRVTS